MLADQLSFEGREAGSAAAEMAVLLIFPEDHGIALHQNLEHILCVDPQGTAQFDRQNDAAEGIQLPDHTCCFHGRNLLV